jgi:hypothetical protein
LEKGDGEDEKERWDCEHWDQRYPRDAFLKHK